MTIDKTTKVLLALLALGVWATVMPQLQTPLAQAETSSAIESRQAEGREALVDEAQPISRTPTSPRPLRWRMAHAQEVVGLYGINCMTVVQVTNLTNAEVIVDVEWFNYNGDSLGLTALALPALQSQGWLTDDQIDPGGFQTLGNQNLGNFTGGWAHVNADDPRVLATGYVVCRTSTSTTALISMTQVHAEPFGATVDFFQAGMPADWTPPAPHLAEPESPQ